MWQDYFVAPYRRLPDSFGRRDKNIGEEITQTPPHKRPVNTVFQKYALFPHLNVYDNIAFGLKLKKMPKQTIEKKVKAALKVVGMTDYEYRDVDSLSGGQQQRVAIAVPSSTNRKCCCLTSPWQLST